MTDLKPEISVIVTNYNHAQYIEQAVESILNQTFPRFEIIIVDDASTDGSQDIIEAMAKRDERIRLNIKLTENRGKWFALNTAIAHAAAPVITLQDADDASCKHRLERQITCMRDNKSFHNLCGFTHCHSQDDMESAMMWVPTAPGYPTMGHEDVVKMVHQGWKHPNINHYYVGNDYEIHGASSMFYKQHWAHGMKFLPGNLGLRCQRAEDSDHNTKMTLLLQKTSVLMEPLYCYRRGTSTNPAWLEEL